jgi:hypothetical protein
MARPRSDPLEMAGRTPMAERTIPAHAKPEETDKMTPIR